MKKTVTRTVNQKLAICSVAIKNECGAADVLQHEYDVTEIRYKNNGTLLEKLRKMYENEELKIISVDRIYVESIKYGMLLSDFIEHAQVISNHN